jgi:hypothetical protein
MQAGVQNIFAYYGLSPKIADLIFLRKDSTTVYLAMVLDYIESGDSSSSIETVISKSDELGVEIIDIGENNFVNGQFTDFDQCGFAKKFTRDMKVQDGVVSLVRHRQSYGREAIFEKIRTGLVFGKEVTPYQSIEELNIKGKRNNIERGRFIKFDNLPNNFTVLDVGCNGAYFIRRAFDCGATYGVGFDLPEVCEAACWLNSYLGYFNVDFVNEVPDMSFDLVFFLSAIDYIKEQEKIFSKVKHLMYFEGHGTNPPDKYLEILKPFFDEVKVVGYVDDAPESGKRVIIKCRKINH